MKNKRIFVLGYFGFYNPGDDIMVEIIKDNFREFNLIFLVKKNYYKVKIIKRYNLIKFFYKFRKGDVLINSGGIFQDVTSLRSFFYYFFMNLIVILKKGKIISLNIDAVDIKRKITFKAFNYILKNSTLTIFRDRESFKMFKKKYNNIYFLPDIVFIYKIIKKRNKFLYDRLFNPVKNIDIKKIDFSIRDILVINKGEESILKNLKIFNKNIFIYNYHNMMDLLDLISRSKIVITGRYHIAILSIIFNKVIYLFNLSNKILELSKEYKINFYEKNIDSKNKSNYNIINITEIKKEWNVMIKKIKREIR